METIHKSGTLEELQKDMAECGFHPDEIQNTVPLEMMMAKAKIQLDSAVQQILQESGLPLYLFDYLIASVQADIRKADNDLLRVKNVGE